MFYPPEEWAEKTNVVHCVFTQKGGVNLDPRLGNRVVTAEELKLNEDGRPAKGSPLIDCGQPVDWCVAATKKKGPWDIGDGTWTETSSTVVSVAGESYCAGVNIAFNNRHPRIFGTAIDVGSGEYWTAPGLMLLLK